MKAVVAMSLLLALGCGGPPDEFADSVPALYSYEPPPKLLCDFSDPLAVRWAAARDATLHHEHSDFTEGLCQSWRLLSVKVMARQYPAGEGLAVLRAGTGTYADKVCRPWREADGAFALCDESGERLSCRCVASGGLAMGPQGFLTARMCFSADPKGCP